MQDGEGAIQRQSCYGTKADTPGLERQSHKLKANTAIGRTTGSFVLALPMRQVPFELSLCFSFSALCHERWFLQFQEYPRHQVYFQQHLRSAV